MKQEHFELVADKFKTKQYSWANVWDKSDENIVIRNLVVYTYRLGGIEFFSVADPNAISFKGSHPQHWDIFAFIPTKKLAEEILQYIKNTEALFI